MGWSSEGYHYTKEELKPAEVRAGCCDGWYWIHKRPNMFIQGYINDDGKYSITFYKPNNLLFEYTIRIIINGTCIFSMGPSLLNNKSYKSTYTGSLPAGTQRAIVVLQCTAPVCDVGGNKSGGVVILNVDLYPYVGVYHNGSWHRAYIYIYSNGSWRLYKHTIRDKTIGGYQ